MVHPIEDGFWERDPYHKRSSAFVTTKGLTTNEKAAPRVVNGSGLPTPGGDADTQGGDADTQGGDADTQRRMLGPFIPTNGPPVPPVSHNSHPLSIVTRAKSPLSNSQTAGSFLDMAATAVSEPARPDSTPKQISQGNIKKKRRSLMTGEWPHPTEFLDTEGQQPRTPDSPPSRASEFGNNDKAARVLGLAL
jgi:glutamine amidotransferase